MPVPVGNPAKKRKVDTAPRQSSRSRQPTIRALYEAQTEYSDDEMDLLGFEVGLPVDDEDDNDEDEDELQDSQEDSEEGQEVEGGNGSGEETAVGSGGEEPAPVVPSKRMRGPGKGAYLLPFTVFPL